MLPPIFKILEKAYYKRLKSFVIKNNLISKNQYAFNNRDGTEGAVAQLVTNIYNGLNNNYHPIVLFLDISKAYDTVDHNILLDKLDRYGIRGNSHEFTHNLTFEP